MRISNYEDDHGILDNDNKTWSGAIGSIVSGKIDIALGWFTYLPHAFPVVDYTVTFDRAQFVILIKKPESRLRVSWTAYLRVNKVFYF